MRDGQVVGRRTTFGETMRSAAWRIALIATLAAAANLPAAAQVAVTGAKMVTGGGGHSCLVTGSGGAQCWGDNSSGQLGDGSTIDRLIATDVSGLASGVATIATGSEHSCAVTTLGALKCWGDNTYGQLGNGSGGSANNSAIPVAVSGLGSGVKAVALGVTHSCALTTAGGVKCWGYNYYGQLGDDTITSHLVPADVTNLTSGVAAITAGNGYSCALTTAGGVKCWGFNANGQLGDGTTTFNRTLAVDVSGLASGVTAIAAGDSQTCAVVSDGAKCWGSNSSGQLGDGTQNNSAVPVDVSGLTSGVTGVATGLFSSCALLGNGGVRCWGKNDLGQLGDSTLAQHSTALAVTGLASGVTMLESGDGHTCALLSGGGVKCWGQNTYGQLGDNTAERRPAPVDVSGFGSGAAAVGTGSLHTCALTTGGGLQCWGKNNLGQLGDNSIVDRITAIDVNSSSTGMGPVAPGGTHTCALTATGGVKCWGNNYHGQVGDGSTTQRWAPVDVSGLVSGIAEVASGYSFSCARTTAGTLKCWGSNIRGQLGNSTTTGPTTPNPTPVAVSGITSGATSIVTGGGHACAVVSGVIKCWGDNSYGQLGDGTTTLRSTPVAVSGIKSGATAVRAGYGHSCAVVSGGVKCWGDNTYGQLGDNTTTQRNTPVAVSGLTSGVVAVAVGGSDPYGTSPGSHSCALTTAGAVKCWGDNLHGQIGDTTAIERHTPTDVFGLSSGVVAISAGESYTCALGSNGSLRCWGRNSVGQLGDGNAGYRNYPADVLVMGSGLPSQTITNFVANPANPLFVSGGTFGLSATGGGSGNPVVFASQTGAVCTTGGTNGATVTMVAAGNCTITADQDGNANYSAAAQVVQTFVLATSKSDQTIGTITSNPPTLAYSSGGIFSVAATATSALAVTFTSQSPAICTTAGVNGATVTMLAAGTCAIAADQAGNASWNAAAQVAQNFLIGKAAQAIGPIASNPITLTYASGATFGVSASGGASGNPVTFTSKTGAVCGTTGVNGTTVTILAAGTCTIAADQAGSVNFNAATQTTQNFSIGKAAQAIGPIASNPSAPVIAIGTTFTVSATGGASGNPVTFSTQTSAACTVGGAQSTTVTIVGAGTCTIAANQAGNTNYLAAPQVTRSFMASGAPPPSLTSVVSRKVHGAAGTFELALALPPATPTNESRWGGADNGHVIVFTFDQPVSVGTATITEGLGAVESTVFNGREMIVTLAGVADVQFVTVAARGVAAVAGGATVDASVRIGFLLGDFNHDSRVSLSEMLTLNAMLSQPVTADNFLYDVNVSGTISLADKLFINANLTHVLPAP